MNIYLNRHDRRTVASLRRKANLSPEKKALLKYLQEKGARAATVIDGGKT